MNFKEDVKPEDLKMLQLSVLAVYKKIALADGKIDNKEEKALDNILLNVGNLKESLAKDILKSIESPNDLMAELDASGFTPKEILVKAAFILDYLLDEKDSLSFKKHLIALGVYIGNASGTFWDYKMCEDEIEALHEVGKYLGISVKDLEQTNILLDILNSIS